MQINCTLSIRTVVDVENPDQSIIVHPFVVFEMFNTNADTIF